MEQSIQEIVDAVTSGSRTAQSYTEACIAAVASAKDFNAIISENKDALAQAKAIDAKVTKGDNIGRLAGVPFIVKDNFLTKGDVTTAASNMLKNFVSPYTATAVAKLEAEGAIIIAKANLDSFAHGSSTENSDFGVTKNPHDATRVPGGSSGGSAAAVALGMGAFALGTDTGGSIRLPASFTGTVGYKPTYGLVSRYGVVAMASSTDVIGPITNSVEDAALVLDVMAGVDSADSTTITRDKSAYTSFDKSIANTSFGVVKQYLGEGVSEEVRSATQTTIDQIKAAGGTVTEIDIPELDAALAVYYIIMPAEVSSNLSRYDGIRYGHTSTDNVQSLDDVFTKSRSEGLNSEVKRRIMIGTYVLSSGYYDAYYKKAQAVRTLLIKRFEEAFASVDILVGPTSPTVAFKIGQNTEDPLQMYLADIMTVAANLVGVPAISIPIAKDGKLPIGLQLMAAQGTDRSLLSVANELESIVGYKA